MPVELVIDQYSSLAHKAGLDPHKPLELAPSWVPVDGKRRLTAYMVLAAYLGNVARLLQTDLTKLQQNETREQGDARLLVNRIVAGVVGVEPGLRVVGSTDPPALEPELPEQPPPAENEEDPTLAAVLTRRREVWEQEVERATAAWEQAWAQWPRTTAAQDWLERWQAHVRYGAKVYESETEGTVPLGDGVLVMGFDEDGVYPTLTVYEPDAYHPVLDDTNTDEFPQKVHLAWEFEGNDGKRFVRRITHELLEVPSYTLPWGETTTMECHLTDKTWALDGTGLTGWSDLDEGSGSAETLADGTPVDQLPLGINWLPVLHMPNTPSTQDHFGRSSISNIIQLLDSIIAVDTDIERAAAVAGVPILGHEGDTPAGKVTLKPGAIIEGKLTPLDLAPAVLALRDLQQDQLERLSINSEVPGPVMGRVNANVVPSGVALSIMFDPFDKLVGTLRLTRAAKYPLLGKWAMRWAQVRDTLDVDLGEGPTPLCEALFPDIGIRDLAGVVTWVTQLLNANSISHSTALKVLQDNGVPIDDAQAELERITREDLDGAVKVADATGSEAAAAERLGIHVDPPTPPPVQPNQPPPPLAFGAPASVTTTDDEGGDEDEG